MQCPSCDFEASQADFGSPLRCPDCGAFYEKALELKLRSKLQAAPASNVPPPPVAAVPAQKGMIPCRGCGVAISKHAKNCPHCGAVPKKRTSVVTWIVAVLAVLWLIGYMSSLSRAPSTSATTSTSTPAPTRSPLAMAKDATKLVDYSWSTSAGGALMKADFVIKNEGAVAVKDLEIECTHFAPSGTRIDSNTRTIFEVVGPGQTRTFKNFDMGFIHSQASKTSCVISDLKI